MIRKMTTKAFTLIEILVSLSIIGILSLLIVQSLFTSLRNNTKTELMKDIKQNGDFAMQVMVRTIQNAESISPCTNPNSLTARSFDGNVTTYYSFENNSDQACRIYSDLTPPGLPKITSTLTSNNITLKGACASALTFSCIEILDKVAKVNISFSLKQKGSSPDAIDIAEQNFSSSADVRNRQL